jgi:hypothetical protein
VRPRTWTRLGPPGHTWDVMSGKIGKVVGCELGAPRPTQKAGARRPVVCRRLRLIITLTKVAAACLYIRLLIMRLLCPVSRRPRLLALAVVALLGLTVLSVWLGHTHESYAAGIYDTDCPLAALVALNGTGLPSFAPAPPTDVLVSAPPAAAAPSRPSADVVRRTDSRAPPLT